MGVCYGYFRKRVLVFMLCKRIWGWGRFFFFSKIMEILNFFFSYGYFRKGRVRKICFERFRNFIVD